MEKRKAFNFFRSYYEVLIMLPDDKSKAQFIMRLCEKQFEGKEPNMNELYDMVKFAYMSQKHSIDASRQGFEDVCKRKNTVVPTQAPIKGGAEGGVEGGNEAPTEQEEEEVQEEVQDVIKKSIDFDKYLEQINKLFGKNLRVVNQKTKQSIKARLKEGYTNADIWNAMQNVANDPWHKEKNYQYCTPQYFAQVKTLDMHGGKVKEVKHIPYKYDPNHD